MNYTSDILISKINIVDGLNPRIGVSGRKLNTTDLQQSIKKIGLRKPIELVCDPAGKLWLVDGHRRLTAVKRMGWKMVPGIVHELSQGDDLTSHIRQRMLSSDNKKDFPEIIIDSNGNTVGGTSFSVFQEIEAGTSQVALAKMMGVRWDKVTAYYRLAQAQIQVKEMVQNGRLSISAYSRIKYAPESEQLAITQIETKTGTVSVSTVIAHQQKKRGAQTKDEDSGQVLDEDGLQEMLNHILISLNSMEIMNPMKLLYLIDQIKERINDI